jgi:tRNA-modifying protein YgfZ
MTETPFYTTLKDRGIVRVGGPDRRGFLQGLVSNDVNLLDTQPCVYACLLTPQGKFLHDFFITEKDDALLLECEGGARAEDLLKKLGLYKLRAKVELSVEPQIDVYAVFGGASYGTPDPRHPDIGRRSFEKPDGMEEKSFEFWDRRRIARAIPDGSRDMLPEVSTLLECNIDRLNGISWDKGCYMGQELTARMHYRGLLKKRLQTVELPYDGDVRSSCGDIGLALRPVKSEPISGT